jgi:hypothetical protein
MMVAEAGPPASAVSFQREAPMGAHSPCARSRVLIGVGHLGSPSGSPAPRGPA